jgi:Abnormal spindle-like microcephaly-assoc'd, ASPM-SPD-2-Hydin
LGERLSLLAPAPGHHFLTLSVTDNTPDSPQTVPLTGTGTYVELSPTSVNFGTQPVGTKSLPKTITFTNKGSVAVSISGISIAGTDPGDFAETNNCGKSVAAGGSCFIKVTFKPLAEGDRSADVSVSDNGGGSPQKVSLTGAGT